MVIVSESETIKEKRSKNAKSRFLRNLLPKVFRTEGDVVEFDPSKIEQSIIKETGLDKKATDMITEIVVRRIISSGIKFLSGPHIREIVCSVLSEQHFEDQRKLYTRIGMPLMDYEAILEYGVDNTSLINAKVFEVFIKNIPTDKTISHLRFQCIESNIGKWLSHIEMIKPCRNLFLFYLYEISIQLCHIIPAPGLMGELVNNKFLT